MAAQSAAGIQTLLEAEKEAAKIVQKARQYRVQRLKDARTEAAKDIEALKAQKQSEFAEFEKQYAGSSDEGVSKVTAETDVQLKTIEETFAKNKGMVLDKIMAQIIKVNPEIHINAFAPHSAY
ncbi:H+-ATPase G subunit-domain-containing protein [Hyaloraphidium curvatum]|nr:H+-ATPase G subunit-domain-containing protein [Hyaloraphidium curvatum]